MSAAAPPAEDLAEKLATDLTSSGGGEVQVRVEDIQLDEYRCAHDGSTTTRRGAHRRVTLLVGTADGWTTEVVEGGATPTESGGDTAAPAGADHATLVRRMVRDPRTGRRCPYVLGAESQQVSTTVTVLAGGTLTRWEHTHRRLWHWIGGTGGSHIEGAIAWGGRLPDPELPRTERVELLAVREADREVRGRLPVLLRPAVALHLVDLLASVLNGQNILTGMRMLGQRVGRRIAASTITVVDDGRLDGPYGALLDDENTPTARNVLLEAGVLRGFLHTRSTAAATGVAPNGCAVRQRPANPVTPGVRGFALLPGAEADPRCRLGDGVEAVAVGRPAVRCGGGRQVRLELFGWRVRDGQRVAPVGPVCLEIGLFEWLRLVRSCGDTLHHSAIFRGLAAPALLLSELPLDVVR